jgi:beta-lactamase class A
MQTNSTQTSNSTPRSIECSAPRLALWLALAGTLGAAGALGAPSKAPPPEAGSGLSAPAARAVVQADIARIAATAGGEVGVLATHLESGLTLSLNADERFPMASTFKIAVAGRILAEVDAGRLSLEQLVAVELPDVLVSEGIADIFPFPGVSVSIRNLIESMLTRSDNTATNVLTRVAGGAPAVTAWVRGLGIQEMRIDGDTNEIIARFFSLPPGQGSVNDRLKPLLEAHPELERLDSQPNPPFDEDARDTTTPAAMVALLTRISERHALSASSTDVLLGAMQRDVTGLKRLRAMLPPGTVVRDKTGTIGGTVNDVGIIDLPDGRGRVAIAVYIKKSARPFEERERVIAEIGRSVYDYMLIESATFTARHGERGS